MEKRFGGKIAIVTGAAGDIGKTAALRFASEGAQVVAVDLHEEPLQAVVADIEAAGGEALAVKADVTKSEDVANYVEATMKRFGGADILFNNAGIEGPVAPLEEYPDEGFDQVIAVNVRGVFLGLKYVVPAMRSRNGGAIVNTASVAGLSGSPGIIGYNASKHAVIGMTRSAAHDLAAENIRVNAVCPAPIMGRMMSSLEAGMSPDNPEEMHAVTEARIPMQRYGEPKEVIGLVTYLCSEDASFLTGGHYTVDGGFTA
ncbi:MAG: SDR family oxidoreductase [Pseudomonadota bacterium]